VEALNEDERTVWFSRPLFVSSWIILCKVSETASNDAAFSNSLEHAARSLGFTLFGIAPAITPAGFNQLLKWIELGYAADMTYFESRKAAYGDLNLVLPNVRSVLVLGYPYRTAEPISPGPLQGRIAKYAWGVADYHDLIHPKLKSICTKIAQTHPNAVSRGVVDSAPVMEREFAELAGLGWRGKNSLLISPTQGSYFFLSCVLTTVDLPASEPFATDHCGTCQRCLQACPTDAFVQPGVVDSRRCISYHTIENRGVIPRDLRPAFGDWLFGCDICQDVCPWNRFSLESSDESLWPSAKSNPIDLLALISLDEESFRKRFRKTPLWRPRRRGLIRNALICLGNANDRRAIDPIAGLLNDAEPLIRGAAAWALSQMMDEEILALLRERLCVEEDSQVREEIEWALLTGERE
jgi:epoxyqueuosine reductase